MFYSLDPFVFSSPPPLLTNMQLIIFSLSLSLSLFIYAPTMWLVLSSARYLRGHTKLQRLTLQLLAMQPRQNSSLCSQSSFPYLWISQPIFSSFFTTTTISTFTFCLTWVQHSFFYGWTTTCIYTHTHIHTSHTSSHRCSHACVALQTLPVQLPSGGLLRSPVNNARANINMCIWHYINYHICNKNWYTIPHTRALHHFCSLNT